MGENQDTQQLDVSERPDFKDFIPLNTDMAPEEAFRLMYEYWPKSEKGVLEEEFPGLANAEGMVRFEVITRQRHEGQIELSGQGSAGNWYYIMSSRSGMKRAKIG